MPFKLQTVDVDGKTYAEIGEDGQPIWLDDEGKPPAVALDPDKIDHTIRSLNYDAQSNRHAKEKAERELEEFKRTFDGIDDPETARKALETLQNIDDKKLIDSGEVEKVKKAAIEATERKFQSSLGDRDKTIGTLKSTVEKLTIGQGFSNSTFIGEKLRDDIPRSMIESEFRKHFSVSEEGDLVATDRNGNKIYSRNNAGEPASFEEAMEILVETSPDRNKLLRGRNQNGGNSDGDRGRDRRQHGGKVMSASEFEELKPKQRAKAMAEGVKVVDEA